MQEYPFDMIKIDRSLLRDIIGSEAAGEVAESIIQLARNLSLSVVAQSVETKVQACNASRIFAAVDERDGSRQNPRRSINMIHYEVDDRG